MKPYTMVFENPKFSADFDCTLVCRAENNFQAYEKFRDYINDLLEEPVLIMFVFGNLNLFYKNNRYIFPIHEHNPINGVISIPRIK